MLKTLGYDPHANPPNYGQPDPEIADNTRHIKKNSDFWKQQEVKIRETGAHDDKAVPPANPPIHPQPEANKDLNWNGLQPPAKLSDKESDIQKDKGAR